MLPLHDVLFLAEGANDGGASLCLVEVGSNRAPECGTDFVQLVVRVKIGLGNFVHEESDDRQTDVNFATTYFEHYCSNYNNVGSHV